jgi:type IV pilus assembly protein PilM
MSNNNKETLFFKDKPVFGLDIGYGSLKVMQIDTSTKQHNVIGYGAATFDPEAVKDGVIVSIEPIAAAAKELFAHGLTGDITTSRVILSVPASRAYNRNVHLPNLSSNELMQAVLQEVDQYVPMASSDLYTDFTKIRSGKEESEYLIVAAPRKIVDSHMQLAQVLGLEVVGVQTTIDASGRLFLKSEDGHVPTVLIDFGSNAADLTVYDQGLIVTGTVPVGGDEFTRVIANTLGVTAQEAHIIKTKYGLGVSKKQKQIIDGLTPTLSQIIKEVRRMIRYYEERSGSEQKVRQIVTMGGGANMPGLSDFLTENLRIPTRTCDPWQNMHFHRLQPPNIAEKSMYVTAAGLALTEPKELFV